MIAEELRGHLAAHLPEQRIADVRIGLGYTAVMLEDGNVGVAYTFREKRGRGLLGLHGPAAPRRQNDH